MCICVYECMCVCVYACVFVQVSYALVVVDLEREEEYCLEEVEGSRERCV